MTFLEKLIDRVYKTLVFSIKVALIASLGLGVGFTIKKGFELAKLTENQEAQLQELYENQVDIRNATIAYLNALTGYVVNNVKRPSYEYLSSVTLYMFRPLEEGSNQGAVATSVIVAEEHGYFYILTNKHVCNKDTADSCFAVLDKNTLIKLEFVKQTESAYDLSLWRTPVGNLPNNTVINGLNIAYPSQKIYSVGQYLGYAFIYTEGTVGGYQTIETPEGIRIRAVIENMSCSHGCSGSGVFNQDGELVGLNFAGNQLSFFQEETAKILAIDGDVIKLFLKEFYD